MYRVLFIVSFVSVMSGVCFLGILQSFEMVVQWCCLMLLVLCGYVAATRGNGGAVVHRSNYIPKTPGRTPPSPFHVDETISATNSHNGTRTDLQPATIQPMQIKGDNMPSCASPLILGTGQSDRTALDLETSGIGIVTQTQHEPNATTMTIKQSSTHVMIANRITHSTNKTMFINVTPIKTKSQNENRRSIRLNTNRYQKDANALKFAKYVLNESTSILKLFGSLNESSSLPVGFIEMKLEERKQELVNQYNQKIAEMYNETIQNITKSIDKIENKTSASMFQTNSFYTQDYINIKILRRRRYKLILDLSKNQLTTTSLNDIISSLPKRNRKENDVSISFSKSAKVESSNSERSGKSSNHKGNDNKDNSDNGDDSNDDNDINMKDSKTTDAAMKTRKECPIRDKNYFKQHPSHDNGFANFLHDLDKWCNPCDCSFLLGIVWDLEAIFGEVSFFCCCRCFSFSFPFRFVSLF